MNSLLPVQIENYDIIYENGILNFINQDKLSATFMLSKIWVNKQPLACIKEFDFTKINCSTLKKEPEIKNVDELHFSVHLDEEIPLIIIDNQIQIPLKVSPHLTGEGLKLLLKRKLKQSCFDILEDSSCLEESLTLKDNGIKPNTILNIQYSKNSVISEKEISDDPTESCHKAFVNLEYAVDATVSKQAPDWRTLNSGFNLEGRCLNPKCESFKTKSLVCIPIGFSKGDNDPIHVNEASCNLFCPCCSKKLNPKEMKNCFFVNCNYKIDGEKIGNVSYHPETRVAEKYQPVTFLIGQEEENIEDWIYLKFTVTPISGVPVCNIL